MSNQKKREIAAKCKAERRKNVLNIRGFLMCNGHTEKSVAEAEGFSPQAVCNTLAGLNNSPRVLDALRKYGVPIKYLADPRLVKP